MKTILVTGGSRGIGKALAEYFLDKGYFVYTISSSGKAPAKHENRKNLKVDITNKEDLAKLKKHFEDNQLKIDALINNAGIMDNTETLINTNTLHKTLEVNLIGAVAVTTTLMNFIDSDGYIINISSDLGAFSQKAGNAYPSYRVSKAALNMFTQTLADETYIRGKNIAVISFAPGWVKTDMGGSAAPKEPIQVAEEIFELLKQPVESGEFYSGLEKRQW